MKLKRGLFIIIYSLIIVSVHAQSKDTLQFELFLNEKSFTDNLKKIHVDTFWVDGHSIFVVCSNQEETFTKVKNAACKSADVRSPSIIASNDTLVTKDFPINVTPIGKYQSKIDEFLNIEDTTIFSDEIFLQLEEQDIHPRSYNYYCMIKDIRELGKGIQDVLQYKVEKKENLAKALLNDITKLIDNIYKYEEWDYLGEDQKEYYRRLERQYDKIYEQLK